MITQLPLKIFLSGFILMTMGHGMEVPTLDNLSMNLQNLYFNSKDELKKLELYIENHKTIESIKKKLNSMDKNLTRHQKNIQDLGAALTSEKPCNIIINEFIHKYTQKLSIREYCYIIKPYQNNIDEILQIKFKAFDNDIFTTIKNSFISRDLVKTIKTDCPYQKQEKICREILFDLIQETSKLINEKQKNTFHEILNQACEQLNNSSEGNGERHLYYYTELMTTLGKKLSEPIDGKSIIFKEDRTPLAIYYSLLSKPNRNEDLQFDFDPYDYSLHSWCMESINSSNNLTKNEKISSIIVDITLYKAEISMLLRNLQENEEKNNKLINFVKYKIPLNTECSSNITKNIYSLIDRQMIELVPKLDNESCSKMLLESKRKWAENLSKQISNYGNELNTLLTQRNVA